MPKSLAQQLSDVHPRMLRGKSEVDPQLSGDDMKRLLGRAIEAAIARAGLTKQEVAFAMGYRDSGVIGRWISGTETPQFAKLFGVPPLQQALCIELAALSGAEIHTHVQFRKVGA